MKNHAAKTFASLALAIMLLGAGTAQAFTDPVPVDLSAEGLQRFALSLPGDDVVARGLQQSMDECMGCQPRTPEYVAAVVGYVDDLFDYYGYDLGATLVEYVELRQGLASADLANIDRGQVSMLQRSGMDDFMMILTSPVRIDLGYALVDHGILTADQLRAAEALVAME